MYPTNGYGVKMRQRLCRGFLDTFLFFLFLFFFFQAEDGILDLVRSRGLGDLYKRQKQNLAAQLHEKSTIEHLRVSQPRGGTLEPVSYKQLTLPKNLRVYMKVVAGFTKNTKH